MRPRAIETRIAALCIAAAVACGAATAALGVCGPFTDVTDGFFCPFVLEIFYMGITTGTTATTYDPTGTVTRLQMAAFLSRTVDNVLKRGGARAAVSKFWAPQDSSALALTTVPIGPTLMRSDGADIWVSSFSGSISRVRAKDGKLLDSWTGATNAYGILVAMGRIFAAGYTNPTGAVYRLDPTKPAGAVTTVATVGSSPSGIAFDGSRIWTANFSGSLSIVVPAPSTPWSATTVSTGFQALAGALFDGSNIWMTDNPAGTLLKLDSSGSILQTVTVSPGPLYPIFDGSNIWVPDTANAVTVVRASNGALLATLTGNGLDSPAVAAFDGQRILVTNNNGESLSLWKAADLSPIGNVPTGTFTQPIGACSDGINFWIALNAGFTVARF
ncbi:MAG TPA: S-layer homology domain-containing protein [Thermoanaerobaculia bacterium]|nr:S-layer homology domain-containing protein [Thermoanaerobaculia bacterium]